MKDLGEEQRKEIEDAVVALEVRSHMPKSNDPEALRAAGKAFAEMWKAGREPRSADSGAFQGFLILMLDHAEAAKDAGLFERALKKLKDEYGANSQAGEFFKKQDERLAKLKGDGTAPGGK